jgi:sporulation protein YlmC with PRC-barrel domain
MFTLGCGAGTHGEGRCRRKEEAKVASEERLRELEEKYEDYKVYDNRGDKIGKVDDLFVDETDREEYIGVKLGFLGRKSTLIPMDIVRVNEADRSIEVSDTKDHVKDAPSFDDDEDITGEYERRIREHFGLESDESSSSRGSYGGYSQSGGAATGASTGTEEQEGSQDYSSRSDITDGDHHDEEATRTSSTTEDGGTQEYASSEGSTESSGSASDSGSSGGSSQGAPNTRQTEETETFQEGGRTKVRRRVVREEIIDAEDDPNAVP